MNLWSNIITMYNFLPPYFTTLYVLYSIMVGSIFIGVVFVILVVTTQARIWKNYSHISYINGLFVLAISLVNAMVFSLTVIMMGDFCGFTSNVLLDDSLHKFDGLFIDSIAPIVETCISTESDVVALLELQN